MGGSAFSVGVILKENKNGFECVTICSDVGNKKVLEILEKEHGYCLSDYIIKERCADNISREIIIPIKDINQAKKEWLKISKQVVFHGN